LPKDWIVTLTDMDPISIMREPFEDAQQLALIPFELSNDLIRIHGVSSKLNSEVHWM